MFRHLLAATCAVLIAFAAASVSAQTISQPVGTAAFSNTGTGQNFTATLTGAVTQIQVRPRASGVSTLYFFNGASSGLFDSNASAVYSQSVTLVDQGSNSAGFQTIVLTTPLPVTAGNVYAFAFDSASLAATSPSAYVGGVNIQRYSLQEINIDLAFTVTEAAPASVPTMTEWAMILFGLILAGGAALAIQRRRVAV